MNTFSSRLSALRAERGMSKSALARAVGVSTTCVWNWEEGNTRPRPLALARIASVLATTEAYLERGVPPQSDPRDKRGAEPNIPPSPVSVAEVILQARSTIAAVTGLDLDQVKVVLEYGA